jgi:hypothetical protein
MKKKTLRMAAWLSLLIIVTGAVIAYRMYHQPARSVADEKTWR